LRRAVKKQRFRAKRKRLPNKYGKGIVSGQVARGNSSITTAGGHGNSGQAKGHSK
jgi:hypothetical protein